VRIAGSVRTGSYGAFIAGLAVLPGLYHGGATRAAVELLVECERSGVAAALSRRAQVGERIPGFGHKVYVGDDPRLAPLMEAVDEVPAPPARGRLVREVIAEAGARIIQRPNVDLGLGALLFVAGLPADTPIFAVARIAGFAAHLTEELGERPVRFRGLARPPDS
jgi:citrate synthase